jgi:(4S)-4-hydroxy-5-phosphonooxypentane-2,3-dione isomerase
MKIVIVHIRVAEGRAEDFIAATLENASHSLEEPGIARFELLRDEESSDRFVLVEGYRDAEAQAAHKETAHYKKWRDLVEPIMAEPRTRALYTELSSVNFMKSR